MGFIVKPLFHREWLSLSAYGTETGQNIFDVFLLLFRISEFSATTDIFYSNSIWKLQQLSQF